MRGGVQSHTSSMRGGGIQARKLASHHQCLEGRDGPLMHQSMPAEGGILLVSHWSVSC